MPHGDNQDYVERLQQDIRELREEYAAARRRREEWLTRNRDPEERLTSTRNRVPEERGNSSGTNTTNREGETLVRRSFWSDLANMKVKLSKKSSSSSKCLHDEGEARESWYRTSRRYTDSRVRRSMRKKPIRERKSNSWKETAGKPKPAKKTIKQSNANVLQERRDPPASKDVYKEILDIVNVNNPNTLPFGKDRMAQWVLTSRNRNLDY